MLREGHGTGVVIRYSALSTDLQPVGDFNSENDVSTEFCRSSSGIFTRTVAHCAVLVKMPDEDRQNSVETSFSELKSPTGCKSVDSTEIMALLKHTVHLEIFV